MHGGRARRRPPPLDDGHWPRPWWWQVGAGPAAAESAGRALLNPSQLSRRPRETGGRTRPPRPTAPHCPPPPPAGLSSSLPPAVPAAPYSSWHG
eukprot:1882407-Prymnesium_polylepis.1